jgi:TusA-related sulfurtransferase
MYYSGKKIYYDMNEVNESIILRILLDYNNSANEIKKLLHEEDEKWITNNHKYNKIIYGLTVYTDNQSLSDYYINHERKRRFLPVINWGFMSLV